jgi:hypothetical protein
VRVEFRDPRQLNLFPAPAGSEDGEPLPPDGAPAAVFDLLTSELGRRVGVALAAVRQLPDNGADVAGAVAELRAAGAKLAEAGRAARPSVLADLIRKLHRRLAAVEELVFAGLYRVVRREEEIWEVR